MVTAPIAVNRRGVDDLDGHRFKRAVGIAIGTVALGALAALLVGVFEDQLLAPAGVPGASARVQLPADLFTAPRPPTPRVIVRYTAPRSTPQAPVPAAPSKPTPPANPAASASQHPSPSPSPTWGGDH